MVREYNDAAGVRETLRREGDTIAAVILEPVFHNAGVVLPEPGFLETLREACTEAGIAADLRRDHHRVPARARVAPRSGSA